MVLKIRINPLLSSYQIKFWYWSFSDWYLVAETWECGGFEKYAGRKTTLEECAYSCRRSTYMFIYGTNDFGENRCDSSGCVCYCELQSVPGRCDYRVRHKGYRLYRYIYDNIGEDEILRDKILFLRCLIVISRTCQPFDWKIFTMMLRLAPFSTCTKK